jgi:hypothetical protein
LCHRTEYRHGVLICHRKPSAPVTALGFHPKLKTADCSTQRPDITHESQRLINRRPIRIRS